MTGVIAEKTGVTIDVASIASASAGATARVGIPIFLMLSDIFPQLLCAHNVITRCETIRQKILLELAIQAFLQLTNL